MKAAGPDVDCLISDIAMAAMNGIELSFAVRSGAAGVSHSIPIVLLTGHSDVPLVEAAKALDVNGFILKPASRAMIASSIEKGLLRRPTISPPETYAARLATLSRSR